MNGYPYPDYIDPYSYGWDYDPYAANGDWYGWQWQYDNRGDSYYGGGRYGQVANYHTSPLDWDDNSTSLNLWQNELANIRNLQQFQAQNAFSLDMWNLQNAYNAPSAQMDRLIQAGINPAMNFQSGVSGNASPLGSADTHAYNPIAGSVQDAALQQDYMKFVQHDGLMSTLGLGKLNIDQQRADTAAKVGDSEIEKNQKYSNYIESLATGQDISNKWSVETFDTRCEQEAAKLEKTYKEIDELKSQKDLNEEQKSYLQSLESKVEADKDLARERIKEIQESIKQREEQLRINWFKARSERISANASAAQVKVMQDRLAFEKVEFKSTVQKWNNDQLLDYMKSFARDFNIEGKGRFGTRNNFIEGKGSYSGSMPGNFKEFPLKAIVVAEEAIDRAALDPSPEALRTAAYCDRLMKALSKSFDIPTVPMRDLHFTPVSTSVENPVFGMDDMSWENGLQ